jgi:hypothetical protein
MDDESAADDVVTIVTNANTELAKLTVKGEAVLAGGVRLEPGDDFGGQFRTHD